MKLALGTHTKHNVKVDGVVVDHYYTPNMLGTMIPLHKLDWKAYARRPMARIVL